MALPSIVRAKFRVTQKKDVASAWGPFLGKTDSVVLLQPVAGPGNEEWSKYTPCGTLEMTINNPEAFGVFEIGKEYYLDFTPAA